MNTFIRPPSCAHWEPIAAICVDCTWPIAVLGAMSGLFAAAGGTLPGWLAGYATRGADVTVTGVVICLSQIIHRPD